MRTTSRLSQDQHEQLAGNGVRLEADVENMLANMARYYPLREHPFSEPVFPPFHNDLPDGQSSGTTIYFDKPKNGSVSSAEIELDPSDTPPEDTLSRALTGLKLFVALCELELLPKPESVHGTTHQKVSRIVRPLGFQVLDIIYDDDDDPIYYLIHAPYATFKERLFSEKTTRIQRRLSRLAQLRNVK